MLVVLVYLRAIFEDLHNWITVALIEILLN